MRAFRIFSVALLLALVGVLPLSAQTATTSTTLSAAVTAEQSFITVASATNVEADGLVFVDGEAMLVRSVSGTTAQVARGANGSAAQAHANAALVYVATAATKAYVFRYSDPAHGACTRGNERYLPQINPVSGSVWDCPTGAGVWVQTNPRGIKTARSVWFNLDNGAGTTIDDVLIRALRPIRITACRAVYVDATTGTVAGGSFQVGTTVGGVDIVAATNYENTKAVGTSTAGTIVAGAVAANGAVFVRHTGVAVTQAGQAFVECDYQVQ